MGSQDFPQFLAGAQCLTGMCDSAYELVRKRKQIQYMRLRLGQTGVVVAIWTVVTLL